MSNINLPSNMKNFLHYVKEVGKTIKSTKIKHVWEVTLDGVHHIVELFDSKLSGKMKVVKDGSVIFYEEEFEGLLSVPFTLGKHNCSLIQSGEGFELRLDSMVFSHMMELERSKNIFGSGNEPVSNVYKPSNEITNKQVRPSFGIGDLRSNEQNQVKPMFNFNIKDNPQQQQNKFGKFDGKFIKLEDKNKQQHSYIQKPIPNKNENKKDKNADPYSSDEKEEIQANNNVEYIDPFSDLANPNTNTNNNNSNNNKGPSNDLDDIFSSYQQTANPNQNLNNNSNFNVNDLIKSNPIQSDDYDFTFKNENDPNKVIQNIKVDQSRSKVIDNILSNSFPLQSNNFNVQSNINQGGFINDPIRNNSSFSNPYNSGVNYQDGNMNMNMGSNINNQGNSNYIQNSSNIYSMNSHQVPIKNNIGYNYQNLQQPQLNNFNNNTNLNNNSNMNMNMNNGNFNYPSSNFDSGFNNDVQRGGGNLDFFDTIKPNSNNFMNQNQNQNQNNQTRPHKNNEEDLNKLDEFF